MSGAGLCLHRRPALASRPAATVLWVHGYTLDGSIWSSLWDLLPEFNHVAPDLPGHGRSPAFEGGETLAGMADQILFLAKEEGARNLVGLSFGGMVALEMAIRGPRALDTIVLASPGLAGGPHDPEAATCNQELIRLAAERGMGSWLTERWMSVPPGIFAGLANRPALRGALAKVIKQHRWDELRLPTMYNLQARPQSTRDIGGIAASILLLVGENDIPAFKRSTEIIRRAARRARRVNIPDAAHLCLLEEPDASAALTREHLMRFADSDANV